MKMKIIYLDACLPEDFQGFEGITVAIPVDGHTTCLELRDRLKTEVSGLEAVAHNADRYRKAMTAVNDLLNGGIAFYPFKRLAMMLTPPLGYEIVEERPDGNDSSFYRCIGPGGMGGAPFNTLAEAIDEAWEKAKPFVRRPQYYAYYGIELHSLGKHDAAIESYQANVISLPHNRNSIVV